MVNSRIEIELELLRRKEQKIIERARENFYEFCRYIDPNFFTEGKPHLKQIAEAFQKVYEGTIKKLAVSMPPRAGKSYITSLFCAWMLGKFPNGSIMRNSYAAKLAEKFSKDIRDGIIVHPKYKNVFPDVTISKTNAAVDGWSIGSNTQPSYFCAGVGGAITGFGCKTIAILDDPIKNIEEALSEVTIESVWNWYTSTHLSRLENNCPEIHIATRWTKKDPIGRLTDSYGEYYNKDFVVIVISALNENGQSFCEEVKTTEEYYDIKKVTEDFIWEAEYMQQPVESKGLLFPTDDLKRFSLNELENKEVDGIIGQTDTADEGTDYLCSLISKRIGDYTYITDIIFTQDEVRITQPLVAQLVIDTECHIMNIESNNGGKGFANNVEELINNKIKKYKEIGTSDALQKASKLKGIYIDWKATTQNKETRILMSSAYIKKYFYFRNDYEVGSDYDKFMRQFTSYVKMGKNKHDDAADTVTALAEYMKENFYIKQVKQELPIDKYYLESELEDMVISKKITKYQMKEYLKRGVKSW